MGPLRLVAECATRPKDRYDLERFAVFLGQLSGTEAHFYVKPARPQLFLPDQVGEGVDPKWAKGAKWGGVHSPRSEDLYDDDDAADDDKDDDGFMGDHGYTGHGIRIPGDAKEAIDDKLGEGFDEFDDDPQHHLQLAQQGFYKRRNDAIARRPIQPWFWPRPFLVTPTCRLQLRVKK